MNFPSLNDSKYIGMSVYNVVIMTLITVSLSYVVGEGHIQAKYALFATAFNVISTFTLLVLFVPKVSREQTEKNKVRWGNIRSRGVKSVVGSLSTDVFETRMAARRRTQLLLVRFEPKQTVEKPLF